jgi:hypothetical protein
VDLNRAGATLCLLADRTSSAFLEEAHMRRRNLIKKFLFFKLLRKIPGFPVIPAAPLALLISAFVNSLRALRRVKRVEHRLATSAS